MAGRRLGTSEPMRWGLMIVMCRRANRVLLGHERFLAAVEEGRASARRGDLLEHDEVVERIEQKFRS